DTSFHSAQSLTFDSRDWRERQAAEIKTRDEASAAKRAETIAKAERAIDEFYNDYAARTKRNIRENKFVPFSTCPARLVMFAFRDQEEEYLATLSASLSTGT